MFVAALVVSATGAFFSDTETSTGNTFTAGALDLKVDSEAHYNGSVCNPVTDLWEGGTGWPVGEPCEGTWTEKDLGAGVDRFFNLSDVKPGDEGENTISLHVYNNDAWGQFVINNIVDADNNCTEPESDPDTCAVIDLSDPANGELSANITFYAWLDQGSTPGFQCVDANGVPITSCNDTGEGDNIWDCVAAVNVPTNFTPNMAGTNCNEPLVILPGPVGPADETHNIWTALELVDDAYCTAGNPPANGHNNYQSCHGIADDGRMVGSTTYYFGLAWFIADTVGNIIQTDSLTANLVFEVEQHRNNPTPFAP